ncbi:MAG: WD40 repeat domain-containing protein, partial [Gemmataceae bacterium]
PHTGREIRRMATTADDRRNLALSPDESLLVSGDRKGTIHLWDAATGRSVRDLKVKGQEKNEEIRTSFFSPDGRRLVSRGFTGTVRVWDVASGRQLHSFANDRWRTALAVSPDGRWLASAIQGNGRSEVLLWNLNTGREKPGFALPGDIFVNQMTFSPDSSLLAIAGSKGNLVPGEVSVWDVTSGQRWRLLDSPNKSVLRVAFSSDGRMLASGHADGTLFLWELASGRRRHSFHGHETAISSLTFSPDRRLLAASSFDAPIYVWDVAGTSEAKQRHLSNDELRRCWTALAGDEAAKAFQAIRRLAAVPKHTLPFLSQHLKPVPAPDRKSVRQLVDMLDSADFPTRQKATKELEKYADGAASLLRQILAKEKPSLEVRRRLQQLLEAQEHRPQALRAVRAVEVLEWIATPDAVRLIDKLAKGAAEARLTREAVAARQRRRR